MNKHRVLEIFCVVFLVIFIFVISYEGAYTEKTAKEIAKEVTSVMDVSELTSVSKRKIKQDFGFDFSQIESFVYYASESIMTVDELMIIKLNEGVNAESITETIEKRVQEKQVLPSVCLQELSQAMPHSQTLSLQTAQCRGEHFFACPNCRKRTLL